MIKIKQYIQFGDSLISKDEKAVIMGALNKIASIPSGEKLIMNAASKVAGRKVIIDFYKGITTLATDSGIVLGSIDPDEKYLGIDGEYYDISLVRVLFYELLHLGLYTSMKEKIAKIQKGELTYTNFIIEEHEPDAVYTTNQFMHQFFDEIPRSDFNHAQLDKSFSQHINNS